MQCRTSGHYFGIASTSTHLWIGLRGGAELLLQRKSLSRTDGFVFIVAFCIVVLPSSGMRWPPGGRITTRDLTLLPIGGVSDWAIPTI